MTLLWACAAWSWRMIIAQRHKALPIVLKAVTVVRRKGSICSTLFLQCAALRTCSNSSSPDRLITLTILQPITLHTIQGLPDWTTLTVMILIVITQISLCMGLLSRRMLHHRHLASIPEYHPRHFIHTLTPTCTDNNLGCSMIIPTQRGLLVRNIITHRTSLWSIIHQPRHTPLCQVRNMSVEDLPQSLIKSVKFRLVLFSYFPTLALQPV